MAKMVLPPASSAKSGADAVAAMVTIPRARASGFFILSPAVVGGMSLFDGHERTAAGGGDLAAGFERCFDHGAIVRRLDHARSQVDVGVHRRGALEVDVKVGGDGAGRRGR